MKKIIPIILIPAFALFLSGCLSFGAKKQVQNDVGGVYKTTSHGKEWKQAAAIPSVSGKPMNFGMANVSSMAMDPGDNNAVYFGSVGNGLLYSYDGADTWQLARGLGQVTVKAVAVDPKDKCVIYASVGNKLFKSEDCSRTWESIYHDTELAASIDHILIDHFDPNILYMGINRTNGDIVRSTNGGETWQTVHRSARGKFAKAVMDPLDSRRIFAVTERDAVYQTSNGTDWSVFEGIAEKMKEFDLGKNIRDMIVTPGEQTIFIATTNGMMRSKDKGLTWEKIGLIPPEKNASINAMAVFPTKPEIIYYVTNTTFYASSDGGSSWATYKLPTIRAGRKLIIDPKTEGVVYMGVLGQQK